MSKHDVLNPPAWMFDAEGEFMQPDLDLKAEMHLTQDQWDYWFACRDYRRTSRSAGKNGVKILDASGDPDQPRWVEVIDALIEIGRIDAGDRQAALRSEWIKYPGCPNCDSSGAFARRDAVGSGEQRFEAGQVRVTCGRKCRTRDVLGVLGIETLGDPDDLVWIDEAGSGQRRAYVAGQPDSQDPDVANIGEDGHPKVLRDAYVAPWIAHTVLDGRYVWTGGFGWMRWDGRRWRECTTKRVNNVVRRALVRMQARELQNPEISKERRDSLFGLLSNSRIKAIADLSAGLVEVETDTFDQHPDLLNVANGVVDLTTGDLRPHDPALRLTKITDVEYHAGATHADWGQALTALPEAVADWLQVRIGQAATGHMTPDDLLPILQGGGQNGKTTVMDAIKTALGEHAATVPEKMLTASPGDHSTEMMPLFGARLAMIEELPEARHLNVKRLKDVVGTPEITARKIRQDNVTWRATHSLFVTTNYPPRVDEADHGTWRRLALVRFPYNFRTHPNGDPGLRARLSAGGDGRHEAVLAWIVAGAVRWYSYGQMMPDQPAEVIASTSEWRAEADQIFAYISERLVFDPARAILTRELLEDFNAWLEARGARAWSDQTLTTRFGGHAETDAAGVSKGRTRDRDMIDMRNPFDTAPHGQARVWFGIRWRMDADDEKPEKPGLSQAETGPLVNPVMSSHGEVNDPPCLAPSQVPEPGDFYGLPGFAGPDPERCTECGNRAGDFHMPSCSRADKEAS